MKKKHIESTKGKFLPLAELLDCECPKTITDEGVCDVPHPLIEFLHKHPSAITNLQEKFDLHAETENEKDSVSYVGRGKNALALKLKSDKFCFRVVLAKHTYKKNGVSYTFGGEKARPVHPAILQPLETFTVKGRNYELRVEKMPLVKILDISDPLYVDAKTKLTKAFMDSGFTLMDLWSDNIGLLPDGTPVAVDAEAARNVPPSTIKIDAESLKDWYDHTGTEPVPKQVIYYPETKDRFSNHNIINNVLPRLYLLEGMLLAQARNRL